MILNDVWTLFNYLARSSESTDILRKVKAINEGYLFLQSTAIKQGQGLQELISLPVSLEATVGLNQATLPTDFIMLHSIFYKSGTSFIKLPQEAIKNYDAFMDIIGQTYFETTSIGSPNLATIKEPYIIFNTYFSNYDTLSLDTVSGPFTVGETVTGGTSLATAKVATYATGVITINTIVGTFQEGETITGSTSLNTADISALSESNGLKISYHKKPVELYAYDKVSIDTVVGTFQVGESVIGTDSQATGTILEVYPTYLYLRSETLSGQLVDNEVLTGQTSSATALINQTSNTVKPQVLEISDKYKNILCTAACAYYLYMDDDIEASSKLATLNMLAEDMAILNQNTANLTMGISK